MAYEVVLNGKTYNLPPFNAGQMRRLVDPVIQKSAQMIALINTTKAESRDLTVDEVKQLSTTQRELAIQHTELLLAALKNQYPELTLDDVETLTPTRISALFNDIYLLTVSGANEPGEK